MKSLCCLGLLPIDNICNTMIRYDWKADSLLAMIGLDQPSYKCQACSQLVMRISHASLPHCAEKASSGLVLQSDQNKAVPDAHRCGVTRVRQSENGPVLGESGRSQISIPGLPNRHDDAENMPTLNHGSGSEDGADWTGLQCTPLLTDCGSHLRIRTAPYSQRPPFLCANARPPLTGGGNPQGPSPHTLMLRAQHRV